MLPNSSLLKNHYKFKTTNQTQPDLEESHSLSVPRLYGRPAYDYYSADLITTNDFDRIDLLAEKIAARLKHIGFFVYNNSICNYSDGKLNYFDKQQALNVFLKVVVFVKPARPVKNGGMQLDQENFIAFDKERQIYYEPTTPAIVACINPIWEAVKDFLPVVDAIHFKPHLNATGEVLDTTGIYNTTLLINPLELKKKRVTVEMIPDIINRYFVNGIFRNVTVDGTVGGGMGGIVAAALGCCAWNMDFDGRKPLINIMSDDRGAGKSVLSRVFAKLTGLKDNLYAVMSLKNDVQFDREFLSFIRQGYSYLELANSDISLGNCDKLANYITDGVIGGKRTGESDSEIFRGNAIISLTAADKMIEGADFERRTLVIKLKKRDYSKHVSEPTDEEIEEARLWGMACIEAVWKQRRDNLENKVLFKHFKDWSYVCLDLALRAGLKDTVTQNSNLEGVVISDDKVENLMFVFTKLREWSGGKEFLSRHLIADLFEKDKNGNRIFGSDFVQDLRICCSNGNTKAPITAVWVSRMLNRYGKDFGLKINKKRYLGNIDTYEFVQLGGGNDFSGDNNGGQKLEVTESSEVPRASGVSTVLGLSDSNNCGTLLVKMESPTKKRRTYTDEEIQAVIDKNPLSEIISETVKLRRATKKEDRGLCPFHKEKTPSFDVNDDKGLYLCRGCGETGNVITWVQKTKGLGFVEAMEYLGAGRMKEIDNIEITKKDRIKEEQPKEEYFKNTLTKGTYDKAVLEKYFVKNRLNGYSINLPLDFVYNQKINAIVCPITKIDKDEVIGCHRLYLDSLNDNNDLLKDENGKRVKKALGSIKGGVIKIQESFGSDTLILTEGVETAMGVVALYKSGNCNNMPEIDINFCDVFSCVNSINLESIEIPKKYDNVYFFGDNDGAGKKAALRSGGVGVFPDEKFNDFLSEFNAMNKEM